MFTSKDRSGSSDTTPPQSFVKSLLTPPLTDELHTLRLSEERHPSPVATVIQAFRNIQQGRSDFEPEPWARFKLEPIQFEDLLRELEGDESLRGYVDDKIRHDYDPHRRQLIIRMPTTLHECFIIKVAQDIDAQLKTIGLETGKTGQFARDLTWLGSERIFLLPRPSKREPDASFRHVEAKYPGVIIEVSYSQKRKDLPHLADSYLLDSNGSTRVLIGIDIEYRGSHKATVSMWRPEYVWNGGREEFRAVQTAQEEVFRNEDGTPSDTPGIRLHLQDFAHEELAEDIRTDDREISISSKTLCLYLTHAERCDRGPSPTPRSVESTIRPGAVRCNRSETPPDTLTSDDEARYRQEEDRAANRTALNDPDYDPGSTSD